MSGAALAARGLVVQPGGPRGFALQVPALALRAGSVLAILGPNGAGKTTLLRALAGLVAATAGHVEGPARSRLASVFQHPVFFAGSVLWNAEMPLWGRGLSRTVRRERARAALGRFGIEALAARDAATLSGGEARRLALARAFATEPAALLLDEPFDDLDAQGSAALVGDLERAIRETRVAVALVTHDLRHALLLADEIAVLCGGTLVQQGACGEVLRHPADGDVAALVGMSNWLPGRVAAHDAAGLAAIEVAPGARLRAPTPCAVGSGVWVGFRPEHVKLDPDGPGTDPLGSGTLAELVSDGVLLSARVDWAGVILHTHLLAGRGLGRTLKRGDGFWLAVRPEDVHVVPRPNGAR